MWMQIVTPVIGIAGTTCFFILSGRRERAKSKREAATKFRLAFAEAITQIDSIDAHNLMTQPQTLVQHDVAISEFRRVVSKKQLPSFDVAVAKFRRCRSDLVPGSLAVWAALGSGKPVDDSDTDRMKVALNELVLFADKT